MCAIAGEPTCILPAVDNELLKNAGICFIFCISVSLTRQGQILQVNSMAGMANAFPGFSNLLRNGSQTFFTNSNTAQERTRNEFSKESADTETRKDSLKRFWILSMQPDSCGTLAPGQGLRLHPWSRQSITGGVQLVIAICVRKHTA